MKITDKLTPAGFFRIASAVVVLSVFFLTCKYPNEPVKANTPPDTRLSNVPPNDTIAQYIQRNTFPELTLSWVGDDPDGYVIAYKYRWTDYVGQVSTVRPWTTFLNLTKPGWENVIEVRGTPGSIIRIYDFLATLSQSDPEDTSLIRIIGNSLATNRPFPVPYRTGIVPTDSITGVSRLILQTPTTGTFIFYSPVDSNKHKFEVLSIDNNDAPDPTPAVVFFWTLVSPGSVVVIDVVPAANSLAIRRATERWPGLRFQYRSLDPNNTNDLTFSWAVDDTSSSTRWSPWSFDNFADVTASSFSPIESGTHRFFVRARNRWGVISPIRSATFSAIIPDFDSPTYQQRILVVNATPPLGIPGAVVYALDTAAVRSYWSEILDSLQKAGKYDVLQLAPSPQTRFPNTVTLGKYSLVIYSAEAKLPILGAAAQYKFDAATMDLYLQVGGKLIISGIPDPQRAISVFATFARIAHFQPPSQQVPFIMNTQRDFRGAKGRLGYPDVPLDPARVPQAADSGATLRYIALNFPAGFGESINTFDSNTNDPFFENLPLGVRFLAPPPTEAGERATYSVVYFGFPLYYGQKSTVIQSMRKAIRDVNE